ncbi:MAG: acyltransferase [Pseudomonadota bacterium]
MKHDNAFDALRLFAALLVIFGHAFRLTGEAGPAFAGANVATTGVKIFFVVSGYLVAQSWLRDPHPGRFLRRRLLRIMPGLVAVVALTALVLGPMITNLSASAYFADQRTWLYLANLAFYPADELPGVFTANIAPDEINGSLWSLAPELSMYLLLPVLAIVSLTLTGAYRLFVLAALLIALVTLLVVLPAPELRHWLIYGTRVWAWFSVAPFFLIGACFAFCGWDRFLNRWIACGLLLLLLVPTPPLLTELLLIVSLPYIVLAFGTAPAPLGGALMRRGDFSYGLYLYAFPIQQALVATVGTPGGALGNFAITAILAGGCAALSWHMIEKPALRAKPARAASGIPVGSLTRAEI